MFLHVSPTGLTHISAQLQAVVSDLVMAHTTHMATVQGVVPPGSDLVSLSSNAYVHTSSAQHHAITTTGITHMTQSGIGIEQSSNTYMLSDLAHSASLGL